MSTTESQKRIVEVWTGDMETHMWSIINPLIEKLRRETADIAFRKRDPDAAIYRPKPEDMDEAAKAIGIPVNSQ